MYGGGGSAQFPVGDMKNVIFQVESGVTFSCFISPCDCSAEWIFLQPSLPARESRDPIITSEAGVQSVGSSPLESLNLSGDGVDWAWCIFSPYVWYP